MQQDSLKIFTEQLHYVCSKYPNLKVCYNNNAPILKGILDITNNNCEIIKSFSIEIHWRKGFPNRFPILYEVGDDIPNLAEYHKYENSSCCITVEADEILKCKYGISVIQFIDKYVISYFANQIYRKIHGCYKNGEYGHGKIGVIQFYENLFKTPNQKKWINYFEMVFGNKKNNYGRNDKCFCGSDIKFKNCHLKIFNDLFQIGKTQVIKDFKLIVS